MKLLKQSLKFKILVPFSLLFLITISSISIVAYTAARNQLKSGVFEKLNVVAKLKKYQLQNWLDNQVEDVFIIANSLPIVKMEAERLLLYQKKQDNSNNNTATCNALVKRFNSILDAKTTLRNISLLTINGEIICSNNKALIGQYQPLIQSTSFFDLKQIDLLKPRIYLSPLTKQLTITLSTPFRNSENSQIGFISVDLELKKLDNLMKESNGLGKNSNVILVAQNSNLLEAENQIFTNSLTNIKDSGSISSFAIQSAIQKENGQELYINHQGIPVIGVYNFLEQNHLILIVEITQNEAFFPALELARVILLIGIIFLGIVLIFVYLLSEKIAKPIREITDVAIALCRGDLTARAKVIAENEDEVGILGKSLNTMSDHLQETFQELTNQKQTAEKAQREAEFANRAKSTFLANMSHELRTPLNAIIGYSEILQEEVIDRGEEDLNEDLQKIQTAGKILLGIVNDILDISKLETGQMELNLETFPIIPLIEEIVATSEYLINQNNNQLIVEYPQDIGIMYGDLTKVRQCLLNLLINAAKFTHKGTINLLIKREKLNDQDWIHFQVQDTGIGIAKEKQNKLFSAFNQVDSSATRKYDGAGLGLAIAQKYSQMMGGNITIESEIEKGSIFCIKLPMNVKS